MKIPFLDLFKKHRIPSGPVQRSIAPSVVHKPEAERLSKTVMPHSTRVISSNETFETTSAALMATAVAAPSSAPRTISFSPKRNASSARSADLPPAVALALEPKVERAISLELAEVVRQLPTGLTKPAESFETDRRILLKAAEIEKGMARGKPSVSLGSIYQQAPEIFLREVAASDDMQVSLPFEKVLEAFSRMQVRRDQKRDPDVPQLKTPFLQATLDDNERFGIPNELPQISDMPLVRLQPATAETIAAAEPESTVREQFVPASPTSEPGPAIAFGIPLGEESKTVAPPASGAGKSTPERIPFHLPPKETGVPASERVPASCGPPVSTSLRPPPEPTRIPFAIAPPRKNVEEKEDASTLPPGNGAQSDERKISLGLKAILQSLPVFQLTGDPKEVPDNAHIELPLLLIQSQLATGRVAVAPELFERSLPPDCRRFFSANDLEASVVLPLQEVMKHLPPDSLRMRGDQEQREKSQTFETPFSTAADEDAKRFNETAATIAGTTPEPTAPEPGPPAAALDAKGVIAQASQLPGVRACALSFSDGLNLAGHLPTETGLEGLCAIAPSLLQRIATHVLETKAGSLGAMTLYCAKSTITFFLHGNISLAALHANGELTAEVRDQLSKMLAELSRTYSQPEVSHVHH